MKRLLLSAIAATTIIGATSVQAGNTLDIRGTEYALDTIYHAKVGPGTTQTHLELTSAAGGRLQVFYLTVDQSTPGVSMRAVCAKDKVAGTETPSAMAKRKSGNGVLYFAGTNADFFTTSGNATNGTSKIGSPTTGCIVDREFYKTSNGNYQFSVDVDGVARVSRLYYYTGTATLGDKVTLFKGVNVASPNNGITLYTPKYWGSTNQTSKAGSCAEVTAKIVEGDKMLAGGKFRLEVTSTANSDGDTTIPNDGVVIHGRGTSKSGCNTGALDFVNGLQVGDIVEFENIVLTQQENGERIVPAQVVSGNPKNVGGGETLDTEGERDDASSLHPRTGIGVSEDGTKIIMMVVDGRSTLSNGVRTSQLADIMRYAGVYEGVNLDGGGSSCLYTSALGVRNNGSDGYERAVGNAIFATIEAPEDNEITEIRFADYKKIVPQYGKYTPVFYGYNKYGVLVNTNVQGVTLSCPEALGVIEGTTLYSNGSGCHALIATYNGIETKLVVTVEGNEPYFKHSHALLDGYKEFTCEILSDVEDTKLQLDNSIFTWSSDDESIATVDEAGVIKGVANGTTNIRIRVDNVEKVLPVTVEIPETHYLAFDAAPDASTWTLTPGAGISAATLSAEGSSLAVDFTVGSSGAKSLTLAKTINSWARPDSIILDVNPHDATVKVVTVYYENALGEEKQSRKANSGFKKNVVNRLTFPVDKFLDATDMSAYPFKFTRLYMTVGDAAETTGKIEVKNIAMSYNDVPLEPSGIENIEADGNGNSLVLTPNPVVAGTPVKLGVSTAVKYTVSTLNGAVVAQGEGMEIPTSGLAAGLYIVKAADRTAKLMVK